MRNSFVSHWPAGVVFAGLLCAVATWIYADRILIPYQIADGAQHDRPRGNVCDLYPPWVGSRELLLRRADPYSSEVTREIQKGYYGRPLDASRPHDPRDQQGFAYPVYVAFLLAPTVRLPFPVVERWFFWLVVVITASSVLFWFEAFGWSASVTTRVCAVALTLGSLPGMQGLKIEQMSLVVVGLISIAVLLLMKGHMVPAGIVLALATIKPQLVWLLLLWLVTWTSTDFRRRYQWAVAFLLTMAAMMVASEWLMPHWLLHFWRTLREYRVYAEGVGVMEELLGTFSGWFFEALVCIATLRVCWRKRQLMADTNSFAFVTCMVLAVTVLLIPKYAPYNQVLLVPAVLWIVQNRSDVWRRSVIGRMLTGITGLLILWPFVACVVLAALSFVLQPEVVWRAWAVPFWTVLLIPVGVSAVMLLLAERQAFGASAESSAS